MELVLPRALLKAEGQREGWHQGAPGVQTSGSREIHASPALAPYQALNAVLSTKLANCAAPASKGLEPEVVESRAASWCGCPAPNTRSVWSSATPPYLSSLEGGKKDVTK